MQGIVGDIVSTISPHSESDTAALGVESLVALGNVIGRGPHFHVGSTRHGLNLFAVVVGETARARKSSTWDEVFELAASSDHGWAEHSVLSGLGSGEGLIQAAALSSDSGTAARGVRITCYEDEFAADLKVMARRGNILSTTLRQSWNSSRLQITTRNSPLLVNNAFISLVGNITLQDLQSYLPQLEIFNGFWKPRPLDLCQTLEVLALRGTSATERIQPAQASVEKGGGLCFEGTGSRDEHKVTAIVGDGVPAAHDFQRGG
jgi:hypothetical protein